MCNVSAQIIHYYYSPSKQQSTKSDISLHLMLSVAERKLGLAFLRRDHGCHVLVLAAQKSYHLFSSACLLAKAMRRVINS